MTRPSHLLIRAGSALIALGVLVVLLAVAAPEAAPRLAITVNLPDTPTPAYLGTPLPPPGRRFAAEDVALVLPVMPVQETAVASPSPTAAPSRTPTPPAPATTPAPTIPARATRSPTATFPPTATPTATASATPSPTAAPRPRAPDRIVIPRLGVDGPVVPVGWHALTIDGQLYGQWDVPDGYAAGWHNTSAPLGQPGNTVLNGHHNTQGKIFAGLIDLTPGDPVILYSRGRAYRYLVAQTMVLQERWRTPEERLENARWIQPSDDERVTLVTCWPDNGNSHRLILVAVPAAGEPSGSS